MHVDKERMPWDLAQGEVYEQMPLCPGSARARARKTGTVDPSAGVHESIAAQVSRVGTSRYSPVGLALVQCPSLKAQRHVRSIYDGRGMITGGLTGTV